MGPHGDLALPVVTITIILVHDLALGAVSKVEMTPVAPVAPVAKRPDVRCRPHGGSRDPTTTILHQFRRKHTQSEENNSKQQKQRK